MNAGAHRDVGDVPVAALTPTQSAIWAGQRLHPDVPLANMGKRFRIAGPLDPQTFAEAFAVVVGACDTLRMRLDPSPGSDAVRIAPEPPLTTEVVDLPAEEFDDWVAARVAAPIDATRCVYDSVLVRHADDDWSWWLDLHHVATDAWASMLVFEATAAAYEHLETPAGGDDTDPVATIRGEFFPTIATIPIRNAEGDGPVERAAAWEADIAAAGPSSPIELFGRRAPRTTRVDRTRLPLDPAVVAALDAALEVDYRSISRELALLTIGAMSTAIVVHRLDGRRTTLVGVPVHHRSTKATRRLVGPVMEIYPLAVTVDDDETHADMFARVLASVTTLLRRARPGERPDAQPEVLINVVTARYGDFAGRPCATTWVRSAHAPPDQTVGLQLFDYDDIAAGSGAGPVWELEVNHAVGGADRLRHHLTAAVGSIARHPGARVGSSSLATAAELDQLALLSPRPDPLPPATPVHAAIRAHLAATPDRVVAEHGDRSVTASEFDDRAERVATWLAGAGVGPGSAVGIQMPRSIDVLVAVHAVLRAGGSFVMLDADDPPARRDFVVADAGIDLVLDRLPTDDVLGAVDPDAVRLPDVDPGDRAYVLYTSGSTGTPKGVPISHEGLADYLRFAVAAYVGDRPPVVPLHSALVFDLTITSLFLPMLADGLLVVVDGEAIDALGRIAADDRINFLKATPSQLELFVRLAGAPRPLDTVVVGGEAFRRPVAERLAAACRPGVRIFNEYGPTEAVVGCMIHEWSPDDDVGVDVPIGRACDGAEVRILDPAGHPSPPGAWGELYVRRPGMATGYLNRSELTAELFVHLDADPLPGPDDDRPWYRTGDRARVVRPGVAVYGGRMDDQLKVSGIRLEPAEVEAALVELDGVDAALVRLWAHDADAADAAPGAPVAAPILTAWYVPTDGSPLDPSMLRQALRDRVPVHALPVAYVPIDEMPLAASAKADPRLLPPPTSAHRVGAHAEPLVTDSERLVAAIWCDVLDVEQVGATDDFFELGGASLDALEVVAAIHDRAGVDLADAAVFDSPTVRALAESVDRAAATTAAPASAPSAADAIARLSAGEEAMLFEHRTSGGTGIYNVARVYRLTERADAAPLDVGRLRSALTDLVELHGPLHTAYDADRTVLDAGTAMSFVDHDALGSAEFERLVDDVRGAPFDLEAGPLLRVHTARTGPGELSLLLSMHHISADASTLSLLWRQLGERYGGAELPALAVTYADYADEVAASAGDDARAFWLQRSADRHEPAPIATAPPSPPAPDGYVSTIARVGAASFGTAGATPFAEAMTVAGITFAGLTGRSAVEFGISANTKAHARAAPLVGYFLNTLPIAFEVDASASFADLVDRSAAALEQARPHRSYPFAAIVRDARAAGLVAPDAHLMFAFDRVEPPRFPGAEVESGIVPSGIAVADATLFTFLHDDHVEVGLEYRGAVFDDAGARRVVEQFARLLERALVDRDGRVAELVAPWTEGDLVGADLPETATVLRRFVDRVEASPDAIAVVGLDGATTTYGALAADVAGLAGRLAAARPERLGHVAVVARRDAEAVVGMLAAQFAGAAHVPIDPATPAERRAAMCAAVDVDVVLVGSGLVRDDDLADVPTLAIGDRRDDPAHRSATDALRSMLERVDDDDVAYTIFTSGSTGTPRAVEVTHANLAASTAARDVWYPAAPERFLVTSSIAFDSSMVGLVWPLATGGCVVLPGDDAVHDVDAIADVIERLDVTHLLMVPSLYRAVLARQHDQLAGLRVAIVAGEACPPALVAEHAGAAGHVELVNEYGPTETTVWAAADVLHPAGGHGLGPGDGPVSIGGAIPGGRLRVVDERLQPVRAGVAGELLIGGPGVTPGYPGDPEATAERFVELDGARWYRSGDRVRCHDGRLVFLGRFDDQLNVGGTRVEPGEIEAVAATIDGVRDAAAVATGSPAVLAIAVEAELDSRITADEVRSRLTDALAPAARPRRVLVVDSLPRTTRGKLDRSAIAALDFGSADRPGSDSAARAGDAPADGSPMLAVWRGVLDAPDAGLDADFFELGGDSLAAVQLVSELEAALGMRVPIAAILTGRTPRGVAHVLGLDDGPGAGGTDDPILLTVLRPGEPGGPIVVTTPSWDDVFGYQALAQALPDTIRVLALAVVGGGEDGRPDDVESFVDAALERCLHEIDGRPVAVVGWSAGGLVAVELAHRLAAWDVDVDVVALVDTYFPGEEQHLWSNRWWKYKSLLRPAALRPLAREVGTTLRRRVTQTWNRLVRRVRPRTAAAEPVVAPVPLGLSSTFPAGVFRYRPQPIEQPTVLYRASTTNPARTIERWVTVTPHVDDVVVAGRHRGFESIMAPDRVGAIADDLARRLG